MTEADRGRPVRLIGWLLTPLVAWAASFVGGWFGAVVTSGLQSDAARLAGLLGGAALGGAAGIAVWVFVLRRRGARSTDDA